MGVNGIKKNYLGSQSRKELRTPGLEDIGPNVKVLSSVQMRVLESWAIVWSCVGRLCGDTVPNAGILLITRSPS